MESLNMIDILCEELDINEDLNVEEEEKQRFRIENEDQADWAFRVIQKAKDRMHATKNMYDKQRKRIDDWKEKEDKIAQRDIEFMEGLLIEFFSKQRTRDEKYRLSTPFGQVTSRKVQDKWEYDDKVILEHLKANELIEYIRIKEEVNKAAIKKNFTKDGIKVYDENGEEVPGIKIYQQPDSYKILTEEDL